MLTGIYGNVIRKLSGQQTETRPDTPKLAVFYDLQNPIVHPFMLPNPTQGKLIKVRPPQEFADFKTVGQGNPISRDIFPQTSYLGEGLA